MRIRSVKPEFWVSLHVAALSVHARLTFIGLWNYADDEGRGVDDPRLIKAALWPLDDYATASRLSKWLDEIGAQRLVQRYEVDGNRYFAIPSWGEHQHPQHPVASVIPPPPVHEADGQPAVLVHEPYMSPTVQGPSVVGEEGRVVGGERKVDAPTALALLSPADDLCSLLADLIESNGVKRPTITGKWREEADRLLRIDGYSEDEVRGVMRWATADDFWKANVLSLPKFRAKYPQLKLAMGRNGSKPVPGLKTAQWAQKLRAEEEARRGA